MNERMSEWLLTSGPLLFLPHIILALCLNSITLNVLEAIYSHLSPIQESPIWYTWQIPIQTLFGIPPRIASKRNSGLVLVKWFLRWRYLLPALTTWVPSLRFTYRRRKLTPENCLLTSTSIPSPHIWEINKCDKKIKKQLIYISKTASRYYLYFKH